MTPMREDQNLLVVAVVAALGAACGPSLEAPPATSAASENAAAAPAVSLATALRGDPPLPGDSTAGWVGLDAGAAPMSHHSMPGTHRDMPGMNGKGSGDAAP